ncbi:MAG: UbiA family prenyltransferase, partial [Armatimonadia bacterium]
MRLLVDLLKSMRPRQWTKNLLVFAALLFAQKAFDPRAVAEAVEAFVIFCVLAGAMYLINDCLDVERDRLDPIKRHRPVASGRVSVGTAVSAASVLTVAGLYASLWSGGWLLLAICASYVAITLSYSLFL